jgi:hypothetical protein
VTLPSSGSTSASSIGSSAPDTTGVGVGAASELREGAGLVTGALVAALVGCAGFGDAVEPHPAARITPRTQPRISP